MNTRIALVCPTSTVLEAIQLNSSSPVLWEAIEAFVGGDGSYIPGRGSVFATKDGPLWVQRDWWIVRTGPDTFEAMPPNQFASRYYSAQPIVWVSRA